MTDDQYRSAAPDGTPAWGSPTYTHDPHHAEWSYNAAGRASATSTVPAGGWAVSPAPAASPNPPPQGSGGRRRSVFVAGIAALVAAALTALGFVAVGHNGSSTVNGSGSLFPSQQGGSNNGSSGGATSPGGSNGGSATLPGGSTGGGQGSSTNASVATAAQQKGVVTITSVLKYQNAESAGTGMILSSDGEILTNNHVISGATSITVTVETTGKSYKANVVGTDASDDVAVIKLVNASGLTKANVGDSNDVATGDSIVGVGNAGGTGTLRASAGKVTALDQTITASDGNGSAGERLHGLIEVNAAIISGDSGGPMYDSDGEIIGMNTAASQSNNQQAAAQAYAIPIDDAVSIADKIESGVTTSTIKQGVPGFLGVGVSDSNGSTSGAAITSVLDGGPADQAGITAGSVITSVAGKQTGSAAELQNVMSGVKPGSSVRVTWTGSDGQQHTASITPIKGPAA